MRAPLGPKSSILSRATKAIAPPPGTGRPDPVNWIGWMLAPSNRPAAESVTAPSATEEAGSMWRCAIVERQHQIDLLQRTRAWFARWLGADGRAASELSGR